MHRALDSATLVQSSSHFNAPRWEKSLCCAATPNLQPCNWLFSTTPQTPDCTAPPTANVTNASLSTQLAACPGVLPLLYDEPDVIIQGHGLPVWMMRSPLPSSSTIPWLPARWSITPCKSWQACTTCISPQQVHGQRQCCYGLLRQCCYGNECSNKINQSMQAYAGLYYIPPPTPAHSAKACCTPACTYTTCLVTLKAHLITRPPLTPGADRCDTTCRGLEATLQDHEMITATWKGLSAPTDT